MMMKFREICCFMTASHGMSLQRHLCELPLWCELLAELRGVLMWDDPKFGNLEKP